VIKTLERRYRETSSEEARGEVSMFMTEPVPACGGSRLRLNRWVSRSRQVDRGGRAADHQGGAAFFRRASLTSARPRSPPCLKEIRERLGFLMNVGLDY